MDLIIENTSSANELQTILARTALRHLVSKYFSFHVALDLPSPVVVNARIKHDIFSKAGIWRQGNEAQVHTLWCDQ